MSKSLSAIFLVGFLFMVIGCEESPPGNAATGADAAGSDTIENGAVGSSGGENAAQGNLLEQELRAAMDLFLKEQSGDGGVTDTSAQMEKAIAAWREHEPNFLTLTSENEAKLKAGEDIADADQRLDKAARFIADFGVQTSPFLRFLDKEFHKDMTPVRKELLAQIFTVEMKKASAALSN